MKTLEQIKDEVAKEKGASDWHSYTFSGFGDNLEDSISEIAKRYAQECCQVSLNRAAANAKLICEDNGLPPIDVIDKESITDDLNIVLL